MTKTPLHVRAWYSYAFAAEVFAACGLAIFLPITLEQMARQIGYYSPELIEKCSLDSTPVNGDGALERVCKAHILGIWVDTASFSMYVKSIAVAVQALCIISVGPLADSPFWRKRLLLIFAYTGSLSAILFLFFPSTPSTWTPVLAALLNILGNAAYSTSIVCSNAFLPLLARENEDVQRAWKVHRQDQTANTPIEGYDDGLIHRNDLEDVEEEGATHDMTSSLGSAVRAISTQDLADIDHIQKPQTDTGPGDDYHYLLSLTTSRLSSTGTALGFLSGVSVLALLLIPVLTLEGSIFSLRLAIGLSGIWWAVFTIPSWLGLPGSHNSTINISRESKSTNTNTRQALIEAWNKLGGMIRPSQVRQLPDLYRFLLAWAFLSDGFHTTTYTAILFASSILSMSAAKIILIGILVQSAAVISSILAPKIQKRISIASMHGPMTNFHVLLCGVVAATFIPIYTCLGLILPFGGLRTEGEMYVLAVWFGLLFGPFLSYSRAVYAELIPPGHESTFFSLFSFTDKSASFLGPASVGLISDLTGNLRYGFIFLLVMLIVPLPVLLRVDVERGARQAREWAESRKENELVGTPLEERDGLLSHQESVSTII